MNKNEILRCYGTDIKNMTVRLLEAAQLSEDIDCKTELKYSCNDLDRSKIRIGIKPNLVSPTPAQFGATTHPEITEGVIEYLKQNGFSDITVAEGSWVGDKTSESFEYCGYNILAEKYGITLLDTQKDSSVMTDCNGLDLNICSCVSGFDYLINIPVLKGHCQTHVTCALKNMKGLIPNSEKRRFHTMGLHKPIAHLNCGIHQDFIIVDHICGDPDFEDGGHPLIRNCVMAAKDPVLTDAYACSLLGYSLSDVPYIGYANELGIGCADLSSLMLITVEGDDREDIPIRHRILSVSYAVDAVDSCSACYGTLIPALDRLEKEGLFKDFDEHIAIGQGHRGKSGKIGVGACTAEYDYCIKGCPPKEEDIYEGIKEYILAHRIK